ncbi:hypothetical protein [Streptomyces sp. TE5632]
MSSKRKVPCADNCGNLVYVEGTVCRTCYLVKAQANRAKPCSVVEDGKPCGIPRYRGYLMCWTHYYRKTAHGNALAPLKQRAKGTLVTDLVAASTADTNECTFLAGWGTRPNVGIGSVETPASRAAWILAHGDPGDADVRHTCNGGSGEHGCVNLRHLTLGTHAENMRDMVEAGRSARGERHGSSKLTAEQVRAIRRRRAGGVSTAQLAAEYGVKDQAIYKIVRRERWAWLDD